MAEMTAEQALSTLVSLHIVGPYDLSGVIEVIEQQAAEIAKKDRMIELAVRQLSKSKKCAMWITSECFHKEKPLRAKCPDDGCWLAWLEKEAEVQG